MPYYDVEDDNNDDNIDDNFGCKLVDFQDRTSISCMKVSLVNTHNMIMITVVIIIWMVIMKIIIAVCQLIFKPGPSDFSWK